MLPVFIGVDPGGKGSICALLPSSHKALFMDTTEKPMVILEWLRELDTHYDLRVCMIEDVHAIQGTSAKSNFSFGYNVGVVNTLAQAAGIMVDKCPPKRWQKAVGVKAATRGPAIKKEVASLCDRLYPQVNIRGPKGGLHDGKSDALMLAHYAMLTHPVHS